MVERTEEKEVWHAPEIVVHEAVNIFWFSKYFILVLVFLTEILHDCDGLGTDKHMKRFKRFHCSISYFVIRINQIFYKINVDNNRDANEAKEGVNQTEANNAHIANNVELWITFDGYEDKAVKDDTKCKNSQQ